jgi:asparagine synthase (glutamine-hydrolysing)
LKVDGWNTKVLLQEACACFWPEELRRRKKQGFGSPVGVWLSMAAVMALTERVFSVGSPLRDLLPGINEMVAKRRDYRTWILLTLGLWLERNKVSV